MVVLSVLPPKEPSVDFNVRLTNYSCMSKNQTNLVATEAFSPLFSFDQHNLRLAEHSLIFLMLGLCLSWPLLGPATL